MSGVVTVAETVVRGIALTPLDVNSPAAGEGTAGLGDGSSASSSGRLTLRRCS